MMWSEEGGYVWEPDPGDGYLGWTALKDKVVYVVSLQLIEEQGYTDVGSVRRRLVEIDRPLRYGAWWDDAAPAIRNSLNRLTRRCLLVEVDHGKRKRWLDSVAGDATLGP